MPVFPPQIRALALWLAAAMAVSARNASPQGAAPAGAPARFIHEQWTVRDGLPVNSITRMIQSRDGYIWLATFDGLVRFDGVRFTVFQTGEYAALPSNRIVDLAETADGRIWLLTQQNHLVAFERGAFKQFGPAEGLRDRSVLTLLPDPSGSLAVGTTQGVRELRDGRFVDPADGRIQGRVQSLVRASDGALWVGSATGDLFRIEDHLIQHFDTTDGLPASSVTTLYEDDRGIVWIGTARGAYRYRDGRLARFGGDALGQAWVTQFVRARDGRLYIGTMSGVWVLRGDRLARARDHSEVSSLPGAIRSFDDNTVWYAADRLLYSDERVVFGLESGRSGPALEIRTFLRDHEGSLWIGTAARGLHRLKPARFAVYSEPEGVAYRNIYPILEDRHGAVWLGTYGGGLSRIERDTITSHEPGAGIPTHVLSLFEDQGGRLFIGGLNRPPCVFRNGRCDVFSPGPGPRPTTVRAIHQTRDGSLWFGAQNGLFRHSNGVWTAFTEADGLPRGSVRAFLEEPDGTLWAGTNGGGLLRFRHGRFTVLTSEDGLSSDLIRALHRDARGAIWVGTEGRGLNRIRPPPPDSSDAPLEITTYRVTDGLFDDVIHQILEDDAGRLWMSSNRGIFWVRRAELESFAEGETRRIDATAYTERDGLRSREANGGVQPAGVRGRDGRLWFPTQDGAVVVDPDSIRRNRAIPPVVIESLRARGRTVRPDTAALRLAADEREFQIDYTALSLLAPENVRFRYRLQGFDQEWVEAGNRRTAFYTNVPPGSYRFRVIASNNDGVWNEAGAALALVVAPRLHETAGFRAAMVMALLLAATFLVQARTRRLRLHRAELRRLVDERTGQLRRQEVQLREQNARLEGQAETLRQLDRMKSRFFANISHEFRTPLTLTVGPLEDVQAGLHGDLSGDASRQIELALNNSRRLLRLVNEILEVARLEAGELRLRKAEGDAVAFVRGVALAFAGIAERKRIQFHLPDPDASIALWFDPDALEKVVGNLLSNAFKFTPPGGRIGVAVAREVHGATGRVVITVSDSGPGIPAERLEHVFDRFYRIDEATAPQEPGSGIGLSLAKELVERHGGDIRVESDGATGTTFRVRLPLGRAHLPGESADSPPAAEAVGGAGAAGRDRPTVPAVGDDADQPVDIATVLIADDNADLRAYVATHLRERYRVIEAGGGREAVELARRTVPDLVISDVVMPDLDGYAVCRALRADAELDFIPVVLLTARAESADRIAGFERGADDYIVKPFDIHELRARVDNLIASRHRLRERFAAGDGAAEDSPRRVLLRSLLEVGAPLDPADARYLDRVLTAIEEHLADGEFGVAELASRVAQDRSHLYRRVHTLTGRSPSELIRTIRLRHAARLLGRRAGSVAEIAYAVGFNSVSYFCKCFRDEHGATPAAYMAQAAIG